MPFPYRQVVRNIALLALGAFLYTLASPPYTWAWAAWFALTPLYLVLYGKTCWTAFAAGCLYGVLFGAGITGWAYAAITTYFPLPFPVDALFTLLSYSFAIAPYTGLTAVLSCILMRHGNPLLRWIGIPALWVSNEFVRSLVFFGFCWEFLGYTQYRTLPLIQIADITGVYGLSFLIALLSYVVAEILLSFRFSRPVTHHAPLTTYTPFPWPALSLIAVGVALVWLYGTVRLQRYASVFSQSPLTVALVQENVPSAQRWQRVRYASNLLKYVAATRHGVQGTQPDLIVWPEFAIGFYLDREPLLRLQLDQLTQYLQTFLLLGAPRLEETEDRLRYYNSAYLLSPDGTLVDTYDKRYLVPFAESRPLTVPALLHHSPEHPSEFTAGERSTVFALPQGSFGVLICYEATYPQLARQLVAGGAEFLVNMSNDTWLVAGGQAAATQHFSMAVFRAVENRRYLVRAATAGISGFVDPSGRPYHLSTDKEGVLLGQIFPLQERTVYARYGDWFACVCVGVSALALLRMRLHP